MVLKTVNRPEKNRPRTIIVEATQEEGKARAVEKDGGMAAVEERAGAVAERVAGATDKVPPDGKTLSDFKFILLNQQGV